MKGAAPHGALATGRERDPIDRNRQRSPGELSDAEIEKNFDLG
jgi:hypothetical protein